MACCHEVLWLPVVLSLLLSHWICWSIVVVKSDWVSDLAIYNHLAGLPSWYNWSCGIWALNMLCILANLIGLARWPVWHVACLEYGPTFQWLTQWKCLINIWVYAGRCHNSGLSEWVSDLVISDHLADLPSWCNLHSVTTQLWTRCSISVVSADNGCQKKCTMCLSVVCNCYLNWWLVHLSSVVSNCCLIGMCLYGLNVIVGVCSLCSYMIELKIVMFVYPKFAMLECPCAYSLIWKVCVSCLWSPAWQVLD